MEANSTFAESTKSHRAEPNKDALSSPAGSAGTAGALGGSSSEMTTGRTGKGTFLVPETHDMVTTLFDPRVPKSILDLIIVSILSVWVLLYFVLPQTARIPVFVILFAIWRAAYNAGIGYLLENQSKSQWLVGIARSYGVGDPNKKNSFVNRFLSKDLARGMNPSEYDYYKMPIEYNTWIIFRKVVDLILMSDFTCYILLALSCYSRSNQSLLLVSSRWIAGIILFVFNLWVKLDAHRVVKDYAWYWGDFFFLEDLELTFDGVFEMAPHPMYSIGYAGYYGICLMTASYTLFFMSVLAHACQFAFLLIVENPHIEKTYNPPSPDENGRRRLTISAEEAAQKPSKPRFPAMLVFSNFTFMRPSDYLTVLLALYSMALLFVPRTFAFKLVCFASALSWRIFHSAGLGIILQLQSTSQSWTRLFFKYGYSAEEAYSHWQVLYNVSTVLSYTTFVVYAIRQWHIPFELNLWPFRYIVGVMLMLLQAWTSFSIYESLGEYGWFYGDFFLPRQKKLTYSGIYRYLNNPERLFGIAGVWGMALITNSFSVVLLAFAWTMGSLGFIQFVEQPHMKRIYGGQIKDSGLSKHLTKTPIVQKITGSLDRVANETAVIVENFISQVENTKVRLEQYPARLTIIRLSDDNTHTDVNGSTGGGNANNNLSCTLSVEKAKFTIGEHVTVRWTFNDPDAKINEKDWVGLYRVVDNESTQITTVSSRKRWQWVSKSNQLEFKGSTMFWEKGVYEFRYHHNGKHTVCGISAPFEIDVPKFDVATLSSNELAKNLLPLLAACFADSVNPAPSTELDVWSVEPIVAKRMAYTIKESCGIEIAENVFTLDSCVLKLANRVVRMRQALEELYS